MKHRYLENVATLSLNTDKCIGCGRCLEVCPHGVFEMDETKVRINERDACMECGACAKNCSVEAIEVNAGVGCAAAIIYSWVTGNEPSCCGSNESVCC